MLVNIQSPANVALNTKTAFADCPRTINLNHVDYFLLIDSNFRASGLC